MFYSVMVKKACKIMFDAHKDDLDKGDILMSFIRFILRRRWMTRTAPLSLYFMM